ncbi:MAG: hypothetical protein HY276_00825 [Ignavibacteriales bacterium]|nr:hypothetical protein [Ignavibacteriales bacterium]MBI3786775.1 hypothetical protein [Ignavibacteriales bacterium]
MKLRANDLWGLLFLMLTVSVLQSQSPNPRLEALRSVQRQIEAQATNETQSLQVKCGTSLIALAYSHLQELPQSLRLGLAHAAIRPTRQKNRLSPSGKIRIHYDTTGVNTPLLLSADNSQRLPNTTERYIDSVAAVFDYCWKTEIDSLGFAAPPADGQQGGGPEYDVYVSELSGSLFGSTYWADEDLIPGGATKRYSTYIEIDNDFFGYRTSGINGLKVTAAHEFHHASQIGGYGIWDTVPNSDFYFYELSAVWMEDMVFTDINDYYFDVPTYFRNFRDGQGVAYRFTIYGPSPYYGYERSIWAHFLTKRFGRDIMREIWEGERLNPIFTSMAQVLSRHGSDLESEFALFSYWNFFTSDRADTIKYYPEGKHYPKFAPNVFTTFNGLTSSISMSASPISTQLYQFAAAGDTINAIVANIEIDQAYLNSTALRPLEVKLSSGSLNPPYQKLSKGITANFSAGNLKNWRILYLESSSRSNAITSAEPSPNPFRINNVSRLTLPVQETNSADAHIFFFNSSLDLMYSERYPVVEAFGKKFIYVPSQDLKTRVTSGIYFVVAECDDAEFKWKVAIIQ